MAIKQLSVFVPNKAGELVKITDALDKANIDIRAMSIADTQDFGILRLIVSDINKAKATLEESECFASITDVVAVEISDEPGALGKVLKILTKNDISIEYMYAFIAVSKKGAYVVLRVEDNDKAENILCENGIKIKSHEEIENL